MFSSRLKQLAALTVQHAVPAICQHREFAAAGIAWSEPMPGEFLEVISLPIYRCNRRAKSKCSST